MTLQTIFTDKVNSMKPYHVPNSSGMVKLDAMESPYQLPNEMRQALGTMLSLININRYPNSCSTSLVAKIKQRFDIPDDLGVILGNGSDELIQMILMATMRSGATVMSPVPTFVMYQHMAEILGMHYIGVDLRADFSIDEDAFLAAVNQHQPSVIFLAYPNNPTGVLLDKHFVRKVIETAPGLVILDEAYTAYACDTAMDLLAQYKNAVMIRTLSKIGLAGIRLGYLVAQPDVAAQFDKVRMPYNINLLTQGTARFMLDQMGYIDHCVKRIMKEKAALYQWLGKRKGITVYPSETNFLLVRVNDADAVFTQLRDKHKILVKNLHGYHPILDNVLRITVGRKKENAKLRDALREILPK
ncbi:MAG: histidinol-phosphate transaminase [Gammaproteobacteria bacterium]|nr:MAG: histidinol-phosphate transaminase [Gammaproteobacteria bacterium]